ncbi:hypothetical protein [Chitinophaga nivalis]|uniref:IPExxxVDY family protein n=1 Tax=Chitinophaga nivalis TaxID=2991709 RepID=A0ABT3ISD6_9BACT|nr:hypothetical protein [Chitinophaga nivalis]MCW3463670.1 hypothetical protein [Chitinophaga nivalis]MCW3486640.1 hypothetical protein [Chitinophaga nivalis]
MNDAFLITDSTFKLSDFKRYTEGAIKFDDLNEFEIEYNIPEQHKTYFSVSKDNSIFDMMDPFEQEKVISEFSEFNIFTCLFYDFRYLQTLVASIPPDRKVIIDNDHGKLLKREDFLKFNSYEEFAKWP